VGAREYSLFIETGSYISHMGVVNAHCHRFVNECYATLFRLHDVLHFVSTTHRKQLPLMKNLMNQQHTDIDKALRLEVSNSTNLCTDHSLPDLNYAVCFLFI
jgi:hypothetical protein